MTWDGTIAPISIAILTNAAAQGIANTTWTQRSLGVDTIIGNDLQGISSGVRILRDGWYEAFCTGHFTAATVSRSLCRLIVAATNTSAANGSGVFAVGLSETSGTATTTSCCHNIGGIFYATVNQHVRIEMWQNSGGTINMTTSMLHVRRVL